MKSRYSVIALLVLGILLGVAEKASAQADVLSISITKPDSGKVLGIDSVLVVEIVSAVPLSLSPIMEAWLYHVPVTAGSGAEGVADSSGVGFASIQTATASSATLARVSQTAPASTSTRPEDAGASAVATAVTASSGGSATGLVGVSVQGSAAKTLTRAKAAAAAGTTAGTSYGDNDSAANELDSLAVTDDGDSVVVSEVTVSGQARAKFTWYYRLNSGVGEYGDSIAVAAQIKTAIGGTPGVLKRSRDVASGFTGTTKMFGVDGNRPTNPNSAVSFGYTVASGGVGASASGDTIRLSGATTVTVASSDDRKVLGIGDTVTLSYPISSGQASALFSTDIFTKVRGRARVKGTLIDATFLGGTTSAIKAQKPLLSTDTFDFPATVPSFGDTVGVFLQDPQGNLSAANANAGVPGGVTQAVTFLLDSTPPKIDGTNGDTLLPTSNDTISDGTNNLGASLAYANDINVLKWNLAEALDSLILNFAGSINAKIKVQNQGGTSSVPVVASNGLTKGAQRQLDFTKRGARGAGVAAASKVISVTDSGAAKVYTQTENPVTYTASTAADSILKTGVYTLTATGTDLAGNVGTSVSRTNVYVDVDDITLLRLFPTKASGLDTIEEETSKLVFKLSEPADSVLITYKGIAGPDDTKSRTRRLSGSSLTNTTSEQTLPIDSLKSGTKYVLTILARDLAGNFTQTKPDTFIYDTAFVVPVIAKFAITVDTAQTGLGSPILAGTEVTVNLSALTSMNKDAVTYKKAAILKVVHKGTTSADGVALVSGTGATHLGSGRISLNADDWVTGKRSVVIKDTTSLDTLSLSIVDSSAAPSVYAGSLDSAIVINPQVYSKIWVSGADTVTQGTAFWVNVRLQDTFGNTRVSDKRYVSVSANKLGVDVPVGSVYIENGLGGFWANSQTWSGDSLYFRVRDVLTSQSGASLNGITAANTGANFIDGKSNKIYVRAAGTSGVALDAPNSLHASDYLGADGAGDQGGFVMLTFDKSADHETLTAYRIWREIMVEDTVNASGSLVELAAPVNKYIPWAKVDAVPGVDGAMYVIVATLDNVATNWAVSAERGRETTAPKQVFLSGVASSPMERMARNLAKSRPAGNTPVFATLTPEALAYLQKGIAPRRMDTLPVVVQSAKVYTSEPVRAIDNLAPEPVPTIRVIDTPNDAGGSISVTWTKSESDRMLPRLVSGAVGPTTSDVVAGVKGYNVYRKSARGEYSLVGKAGPGEVSFVDATVFNGERYTYKVSPYDEDNITSAALERTAMAIRNRVFDRTGAVVLGLFGVDNRVGFDDFFLLADRFGLTAADEGFDPAFDLRPDNKVDFDDFFVFADNFGKAIEGAAKVVPVLAGLNTDARLELNAGSSLPRIGEELAVAVDLADFVAVKGYGFSLTYDPAVLEFVKAVAENSLLGASPLAQPQIVDQAEGAVSIAAFGQRATQGDLGVSLIFRPKAEIENSYIELTEGALNDGSDGLNQVASLGAVQVQTRPEVYALADNYPNPFNPETTLKYQLPEAAEVRLEVYNVVGQVVRTLVAEPQSAGRYVVQWDAANDHGQPLSSGIYFYHIQAGAFQKTKKMLLLK